MTLYKRVKCPDCEWSQFQDGETVGMTPCPRCNSTGYVYKPFEPKPEEDADIIGRLLDRGWIPPEEAKNYVLIKPDEVDMNQVVGHGGEVDDSDMTPEETAASILAILKPDRLLTDEEMAQAFEDAHLPPFANPYLKVILKGEEVDMKVEINRLHCKRCGHSWYPKQQEIRICPKCKSPYWDKIC